MEPNYNIMYRFQKSREKKEWVTEVLDEGLSFIEKINEYGGVGNNWIIVREAETNWSYGEHPCRRGIEEYIRNGVINLDKPPGPTSHEVVAWIKKMLGLQRAGHGGTLEPR